MKANRNPIPVTVIGGFLGAGKTTLLNHVLSAHHGVRAGVLVNDFGAVNIDAKLVVGVEGETVSLANGCVCCTIRDDLMGACLELLQRPEPPEHLLIEMSGVANPVPVLETFLQPDLGDLFSLNSSLVVVDAEQLPEFGGELGELARAQIAAADLVVLNKVDLVTRDRLAVVPAVLRYQKLRERRLSHGQVLVHPTKPKPKIHAQKPAETLESARTMIISYGNSITKRGYHFRQGNKISTQFVAKPVQSLVNIQK